MCCSGPNVYVCMYVFLPNERCWKWLSIHLLMQQETCMGFVRGIQTQWHNRFCVQVACRCVLWRCLYCNSFPRTYTTPTVWACGIFIARARWVVDSPMSTLTCVACVQSFVWHVYNVISEMPFLSGTAYCVHTVSLWLVLCNDPSSQFVEACGVWDVCDLQCVSVFALPLQPSVLELEDGEGVCCLYVCIHGSVAKGVRRWERSGEGEGSVVEFYITTCTRNLYAEPANGSWAPLCGHQMKWRWSLFKDIYHSILLTLSSDIRLYVRVHLTLSHICTYLHV